MKPLARRHSRHGKRKEWQMHTHVNKRASEIKLNTHYNRDTLQTPVHEPVCATIEEVKRQNLKYPFLPGSPGANSQDILRIVVGTGFWTSILSPVFWAGLSQITRFWTNQIPAAVPVIKSRVND